MQVLLRVDARHGEGLRQRATLAATNRAAGLPSELVEDLRELDENSCRQLSGGWQMASLTLARRVKQRDPLSAVNFDMLIDDLLLVLFQEIGATFNKQTIRTMAFADDLVVLDESLDEVTTHDQSTQQPLYKRDMTQHNNTVSQM